VRTKSPYHSSKFGWLACSALAFAVLFAPRALQAALMTAHARLTSMARVDIIEVRVEGNRRVEAEAIARSLRAEGGQAFDPSKTERRPARAVGAQVLR
jgi:hypothetical protein